MARFRGNTNRIARRFGVNIFGKARNPMLHKPHPPGMHGARRKKKSDYGLMLEEKQKLKAIYGMLPEKHLVTAFKKAFRLKGNTALHLAQSLECRLDNIVYRLKFANSIFGAQQLVAHGHILVDGKKVDRRNFQVKPGMVVAVKEGSRKVKPILESLESPNLAVPEYLSMDKEKFSGQIMEMPSLEQMPWPIEISIQEVCDFIAHSN